MIKFTTAEVELMAFAVADLRDKLKGLWEDGWVSAYKADDLERLQNTLEAELAERARSAGK